MHNPKSDVISLVEDSLIEPLYIQLSEHCTEEVWDYICKMQRMQHINRLANRIYIKSVETFL